MTTYPSCETLIQMCTLIILRQPNHPWSTLIAANRDEMLSRAWDAPARHWPDRPTTVAGLDHEGHGSWLGVNDYGVVAGILNRAGTLGPEENKRSRGEIVLEVLEHADAKIAAKAISDLDERSYRPFNLVIADNRDAYWVAHRGNIYRSKIEVHTIPLGLSMLTSYDLNDKRSPRIRNFLTHFQNSPIPNPDNDNWDDWKRIMCNRSYDSRDGPTETMNISTDFGFGTSSSSFIAIPSDKRPHSAPIWKFSPGAPDTCTYDFIECGSTTI